MVLLLLTKLKKKLERKKIKAIQKGEYFKKKFENKIKNLINEKESNFENELVTLKVMGFLNEELNLQLLSKYSKLEKSCC